MEWKRWVMDEGGSMTPCVRLKHTVKFTGRLLAASSLFVVLPSIVPDVLGPLPAASGSFLSLSPFLFPRPLHDPLSLGLTPPDLPGH